MAHARMHSRRPLFAAVAAAALVVAMTACSPGASPSPSAGDAADPDAELKVGWSVGIQTLDPQQSNTDFLSARFGLALLYDPLFVLDSAGEPQPNLVTAWEYRNDGLTLAMDLRDDVTFHDGTPVDAEAVKATLDRGRTQPSPLVQQQLSSVEDVRVTAPYSVELDLSKPTTSLPYTMSTLAGYIMHPDFDSYDPATEANGSGPYVLDVYTPGESLSLTREAEDYWQEDCCQFAKITNSQIADPQALSAAISGGQIDIAGSLQPNILTPLLDRTDLETVRMTTGASIQLLFNYALAPLDDIRVREAVNLAFEREAIVDAMSPGSAPMYQWSREGKSGYDAAYDENFAYDPDRAKELLADAGYPDGLDLGTVLVGTNVVPGLIDVVIDQLGDVGISLTAEVVDGRQVFAQFGEGTANALLGNVSGGVSPVLGAADRWGLQFYNPGGTTPEFDELLAAADDNRLSAEESEAALETLYAYPVEQAWGAPLVLVSYGWVSGSDVRGISPEMNYASVHGGIDLRYVYKVQ